MLGGKSTATTVAAPARARMVVTAIFILRVVVG
jgi:hypothetical protein